MLPVVTVDLGGTNIRAAYYPAGEPPAHTTAHRPTPAGEGPAAVIEQIHRVIEDLRVPSQARPKMVIGIGAPGPLDARRGLVLHAPNLVGWDEVPLAARLEQRWGCPAYLQNDANLAALGEWKYGSGRGARNLIMLTLGTGIGGGVVVDSRLLEGDRGLGGELGHIPIDMGGRPCSCGRTGHLEAIASGTAIAAEVERRGGLASLGPAATSEAIAAAAAGGEALAIEVLGEAARAIGLALAGLVHIFNPEIVVLGGGVSRAGSWFLEAIERSLRSSLMLPAFGADLRLVPSSLGDEAALLGALAFVHARV